MPTPTRRRAGAADPAVPASDLRAQHKQLTRRRLLAAAVDVFEEKGYEAATIDDVVARAGAARATFYLHFSGKADIVAELAARIWRDTESMFVEFGTLPDWSHATIRGWLTRYVDADGNKKALKVFAEHLPHTLREQHLEHQQRFIHALLQPPERWTHFTRPEAKRRAFLLINQLETFMPSWQAGLWGRERSAMLDTLTAVWLGTLEADRTGQENAGR
ncbi:TetR/AcrR family transcriptional regulator [Yinghuangia soli]|uniref:TetR/AcrR family transcriptional regulator n=1 Tax=Yinghuangia soli TaxID=2908204 RepID=A0AA41Q4D0_9ACTN|nr:TetR/AcrR family transcriptional regulator [Yinghuangia soli]MCF2531101.1 TetR/AcrR family transcriptional regulator [Yinghuangia soli]